MKSTRLVDFLPRQKDKVFRIVGFETKQFFDREFSLNTEFEECEDENTTEVFNSLCEIVEKLDTMQVGETLFHDCIRDNEGDSKCVIQRIK
ncbi:MAG: hypothetical protein WCK78_04125 [Paludibacter sp.]